MAKKISSIRTTLRILGAVGGATLTSAIGVPWLGAMAGSCLPDAVEEILGILTASFTDEEKKKALEKFLVSPLNSLVPEIFGGIIDKCYQSHQDAKESELNFDLPRAVIKVWEEALNNILHAERDASTLGLKRDDEFEKARKKILTFWRQKLHKAQSDNELLKEFFGEKPDYFLDVGNGKASFIDVLPDQKQVEVFFWKRIENSFTNWAKNEEKFPKVWTNSIHQSLKDELKQNLFNNFSSALKDKLKENERAWKSFEFASSLQTVSMLQSLKTDTNIIKEDLVDLIQALPLVMKIILGRFDDLDKTIKDSLISNQNINKLLIDFRKEVSEKLSEISKDVNETKDYARQAAKNTEKSFKNRVTFKLWKKKRDENKLENRFVYVETQEIKDIVRTFTEGIFSSPKHFILKGDISSGKSTIINKIGETLLELDKNIKIVILPLTRGWTLEEGWQRNIACWEFNEYLKQVALSKTIKAVFIVEDAHEGEGNPGHRWARNLDEDFSPASLAKKIDLLRIPLFVTTRPDNFEKVKNCLKEAWKIEEPSVYETKPEDVVNRIIISQSVPETTAKKLWDSYLKCGKILLIFNEIISEWKKAIKANELIEKNFMIYAYKAVYEEFNRVLPENDLTNESSLLTLAIIWMAGGLELSIDESFVNSNFHVLAKPLWKQLEQSNEIRLDDDEKYLTNRHPAWGLLTITALDNYREFSSIRQLMRKGFLKNLEEKLPPEKEEEIASAKPSVLLMTALLNSKITTPTSLGFYCGGRQIQDEFITAVGYHYNILLSKPDANKERISESLLSIATNVRQSNSKGLNSYDPIQRQEVIKEGYERLNECIKSREELSGKNLENDPRKGAILYEKGYYQFLKGDFAKSAKIFQESKNAEINSGNTERLQYAAISGVMEANSLICSEKLEEANKTLEEMEQILENINNADKNVLCRFKCGAFGAYVELYLAKRNVDKALEYVKKYMDEGDKINLYVVDLLYRARIFLLQGNGQKAEELVGEALKEDEFMKGAENKISAHRILGDALLMQDKKKEAYEEYDKILPSTNSDFEYLDFNLRIIKARRKKLDDGGTIKESFQDIRI